MDLFLTVLFWMAVIQMIFHKSRTDGGSVTKPADTEEEFTSTAVTRGSQGLAMLWYGVMVENGVHLKVMLLFVQVRKGLLIYKQIYPLFIETGCNTDLVSRIHNGHTVVEEEGAIVRFYCKEGSKLEGPKRIHCDGEKWSDNPPHCLSK